MIGLPWKAIGVGVLALVVIGAAIGLINYGQKLERALNEVERLEGELSQANKNTDVCLDTLHEAYATSLEWQTTAQDFQIKYSLAMDNIPETRIIYRNVAATVPTTIPTGNCDLAALGAYRLLETNMIIKSRNAP